MNLPWVVYALKVYHPSCVTYNRRPAALRRGVSYFVHHVVLELDVMCNRTDAECEVFFRQAVASAIFADNTHDELLRGELTTVIESGSLYIAGAQDSCSVNCSDAIYRWVVASVDRPSF